VLAEEKTPWTRLLVAQWYGEGPREVEVATDTAVWYHTGKPPVALRWVLIRDPHERFKPQALLSTNLEYMPAQILTWFVRRWTMEVTFEEARAHLGMETQRQWNERAIARTTPALLSLYSIIALNAHLLIEKGMTCVRSTAWYRKTRPTFADAIALVRRQWWDHLHFSASLQERCSPGNTLKKEKSQTSDQYGWQNTTIGGLTHAQTQGLGSALPQCGLFSLSADEPRQRERHLYLFDPEWQTTHLPL
jgi:hypothetical protein